jgi:hypothetical protein
MYLGIGYAVLSAYPRHLIQTSFDELRMLTWVFG